MVKTPEQIDEALKGLLVEVVHAHCTLNALVGMLVERGILTGSTKEQAINELSQRSEPLKAAVLKQLKDAAQARELLAKFANLPKQ